MRASREPGAGSRLNARVDLTIPRLSSHQLTLRAGTRTLLDGLDVVLEPGEVLGILGANGAGKSTLLAVLAGLGQPASGQVELDGHPLDTLSPRARAQHIGVLPQSDESGYFGRVREFVLLGQFPFTDAPLDLNQTLAAWELTELAERTFDTLSGGERQRARLAQLAMQAPQITLLDEPLTHLDPAHQGRLLAWARSEAQAGRSVAMTLHDPNWAAAQCDRLLFLYGDGNWRLGACGDLLTPHSLEALYGPGSAALWRQPDARQPV